MKMEFSMRCVCVCSGVVEAVYVRLFLDLAPSGDPKLNLSDR